MVNVVTLEQALVIPDSSYTSGLLDRQSEQSYSCPLAGHLAQLWTVLKTLLLDYTPPEEQGANEHGASHHRDPRKGPARSALRALHRVECEYDLHSDNL